jgi:hypothetical protein
MGFLSQSFDLNDLPQSQGYGVLPAGWYSATISKADVKPTKAGTGEYINICYSITGPTHQGRTVWGNINIRNPNPKAEEIGRQQLGELMRAIGVGKVSNTDQLIGKDLMIKLTVRDDDKSIEQNEVRGFKAVQGGQVPSLSGVGVPMPALAVQPDPAPKAAPPWAKK